MLNGRNVVLIFFKAAVVSLAVTTGAIAQNDAPKESVEFAPGSTGGIAPGIAGTVYQAERDGEALRDQLTIQDPMAYEPPIAMDELRKRALNHPRVRALLNADDPALDGGGQGEERYGGAHIWVLASFSMPPQSLRQLLSDATRFGVPVVMRGFVNNSVYETRNRLIDVFGSDEAIEGFGIDPTMFTRFNVNTVPTVIGVRTQLEICDTPGCEGDVIPDHDRVAGNVRIEHALRLIASSDDAASHFHAVQILQKQEDQP